MANKSPRPGKGKGCFLHDSASHGACDSPQGIPLRPRHRQPDQLICPSAATPFPHGLCPCLGWGTHRDRASISGSFWRIISPLGRFVNGYQKICQTCPGERRGNGKTMGKFSPFQRLARRWAMATTTEDRAKRAMALGMTIRLLNRSVSPHTRSLDMVVPRKMNTRASTP